MKDSFYSSFENKYRGSRDSIKSRLKVYIKLAKILITHFPDSIALDLGCGRGEWLEMVRELGFKEIGVDLDDGMLNYCHELNLNVEKKDALEILASFPDDSVAIVSSFHLVEHIGFNNVNELVKQALRVLKPGGILIMETPNPENLIVSSNNYFLDPTHNNPIPRQLLSFLTEHAGFARTKILRLQEDSSLFTRDNITLYDVISGVSPDYSVVAQKVGDSDFLSKFADFFSASYGISLKSLSNKYNQGIQEKFTSLANEIMNLQQATSELKEKDFIIAKIKDLEATVYNLEEETKELKQQAIQIQNVNIELKKKLNEAGFTDIKDSDEIDKKIHEKVAEFATNKLVLDKLFICQEELKASADMIIAMRNSTSWRISFPVRLLGRILKGEPISYLSSTVIKKPIKIVLSWLINKINKNPKRRIAFVKLCKRTGLDKLLRPLYSRFINHAGIIKVPPQEVDNSDILNAKLSFYGEDILNKLNK
ncbi:methyltransferase domain-containing protein [Pantoea osteomyelitidis]|uniref:Methyltransferase domain-containing protein n=1 Tax=Pantoea osteomyelitidis TaxID=3230026 RepID=A0ABW7PYY5_9GAMM